jgi:hypothetical protein
LFRGEGVASAVEQHQPRCCAGSLPGHKIKQRFFAPESDRFDGSIGGYAFQVQVCSRPEQIAPRPLGDKGEGKVQRGSPRIQAFFVVCYLRSVPTCSRIDAMPAPSITASIMASQPMQELIIMW